MKRLILASGSPRRKELLSYLNIPFEIIVADINEKIDYSKPLRTEIEKLSFEKANAVFKDHEDAIVIGSDTIVSINGKVLGKPKSKEEAIDMLHILQDNVHEVITAVSIISKEKRDTFSRVTKVRFKPMSDEEIVSYVDTKEPLDKAGAYGIQGHGAKYVDSIEGDYYTVMGLPVSELYNHLKTFTAL